MVKAIAGAIISGGFSLLSANAAKKAASTQATAFERAAELQHEQFLTTREDLAPWRRTGTVALTELADLYGLPVEGRIDGTLIQGADGTFALAPGGDRPFPRIHRDLVGKGDRERFTVFAGGLRRRGSSPVAAAAPTEPDLTREQRQQAAFDQNCALVKESCTMSKG